MATDCSLFAYLCCRHSAFCTYSLIIIYLDLCSLFTYFDVSVDIIERLPTCNIKCGLMAKSCIGDIGGYTAINPSILFGHTGHLQNPHRQQSVPGSTRYS